MSDRAALERFQAAFPRHRRAHLNNAGVAPMCRPAIDAAKRVAEAMAQGSFAVGELLAEQERARERFAALVGARPHNVSFLQTCAAAITQVALGLPLAEGDEILTWDQEYPSNAYPWLEAARRAGGRVVRVPSGEGLEIDTSRLIEAMTPRTRVVAVSWVQFQTGELTDLVAVSEACRKVGAWLVVDAIQGLGVVPFDLDALGVDAVCGGTHKWLCGPVGHGFVAFRAGRRDEVRPLFHGAITYGTPDDPVDPKREPRRDPRRFEPGTPLLFGAVSGAAAIDLILEAGPAVLGREANRLSDRLTEGLLARGARVLSRRAGEPRSPIVTFVPRGDIDRAADALRRADVAFSRRGGGIRIAPHAFNRDEEIDRVLSALDEASG